MMTGDMTLAPDQFQSVSLLQKNSYVMKNSANKHVLLSLNAIYYGQQL